MSARTRSTIGAVTWRTLHRMYTNPSLLLPSLIFPLFFFAAFAGGLSAISKVPGFNFSSGYTAFQFVFVLLQASAFGGVFTGFGIAADFESGFARRMLLAASNRLAIVAGYCLAALIRALLTMTLLFGVALIAGMQIGGDGVDIAGLVVLALLVNLSAGLFAAGVAMRLRTIQAGPLMQIPVFLILFTAPVFVPLGLLKGWISSVAPLNPVTRLLETGRGFIAGEPTVVLGAFVLALGLAALFAVWAIRGMRSAERAI
jgi:ABC-2 type transport system permease protein